MSPASTLPADVAAVSLGGPAPELDVLARQAAAVRGSAGAAVELARSLTTLVPPPGEGETLQLWRILAALAAADLTSARVAEAHFDALAIHRQAVLPVGTEKVWGVFAAEAPGVRVDASHTVQNGWSLTGIKPWCSLGDRLDGALVTAHTEGGHRRLFAVDLHDVSVVPETGHWHSTGLREVDSGPIRFNSTPALPVGDDEWYLTRPGFSWGGMGVAACWYGGTVGVARALLSAAMRKEPDQIAAMHIGAVDTALVAARRMLEHAAAEIDAGIAVGERGVQLALQVRAVVSAAAETVITRVGHALGPAPLAFDELHAQRVADLSIYIRQQHAERDEVALGRTVLGAHAEGLVPW